MSVQLILMGVIRIATIVLARSFALVIMDTGSMLMARHVMVSGHVQCFGNWWCMYKSLLTLLIC